MPSKDLKHELVADLKRVAQLLGHTPTRDEYRIHGGFSDHHIREAFGSYSIGIQASGLDAPIKSKSKDALKEIFHKDVALEIKKYREGLKNEALPDLGFEPILVVGDAHFPFVDTNALSAVYAFCDVMKPKHCVQVGDLYDMFSHSRFPRSMNVYTPKDEMDLGFKMAQEFWATLQKLSPGMKCYQILGNHDSRPLKKILEHYPEGEIFFSIDRFFQFEGVQTTMDPREPLIIQDIAFTHGFGPMGVHRDILMKNTVRGHSHKGGIHYKKIGGKALYELDVGFIGDVFSKVLSYTPLKVNGYTTGFGYIDAWGPRFIST